MGSDESHFNVSLIARDKVTRQCPETTIFEEKGESKRGVPCMEREREREALLCLFTSAENSFSNLHMYVIIRWPVYKNTPETGAEIE